MALSEIDPSSLPTSERIRRHEFSTVRRGYDQVQVRDYLKKIAGHVAALDHKLEEARREARKGNEATSSSRQPTEDPYNKLASKVAELLRTAEGESGRLVQEAQVEAARILDEARSEAGRVVEQAEDHAEEARREASLVLSEAKVASEHTLATLTERRETLIAQLHQMQAALLDAARELETTPGESESEAEEHVGPDRPDSEPVDAEPSRGPRLQDHWAPG